MSNIVAVDIDLTLAASDSLWWKWLNKMCRTHYMLDIPHGEVEYDLSKYFKYHLEEMEIDPLDFWRATGVYDWVTPIRGSQSAIKSLYDDGLNLITVSHIKGNHHKSKYQFIKRYYGNCFSGFIATKEKYFVRCDYLIDDRNSHLNKMPEDVTCIRFDTPYIQDEEPTREILVARDWNEVLNIIEEREDD